MKKVLDQTPKLFTPAEAEEVAQNLKASDPDWDYRADYDPKGTGYSRVAVYDEDGEFVGYY